MGYCFLTQKQDGELEVVFKVIFKNISFSWQRKVQPVSLPVPFVSSVCLCLVVQLYPTLCDPMDGSPFQASLFMVILQARILAWTALPSPRGSSQPRDQTQVSHAAGSNGGKLSHQGSPSFYLGSLKSFTSIKTYHAVAFILSHSRSFGGESIYQEGKAYTRRENVYRLGFNLFNSVSCILFRGGGVVLCSPSLCEIN